MKLLFYIQLIAIIFSSCESSSEKNDTKQEEYFIGLHVEDDVHPNSKDIKLTQERVNEKNFFVAGDTSVINTVDRSRYHYKFFKNYMKISKEGDSLKCAYVYIDHSELKLKDSVNLSLLMKAICKTNKLYELDLFSDMSSYYEYIKDDAVDTEKGGVEIKRKKIKKGYIGKLRKGIFYYY